MTTSRMSSIVLAAALLPACGAGSENAADTTVASEPVPARGMAGAEPDPTGAACGFAGGDADITVEDMGGDSVAMVFRSKRGDVTGLTGHVETYQQSLPAQLPADSRSGEADLGPRENEDTGTGMTNQQAGVDTEQVALTSRVEPIEGGVRIVLTPRDPLHLNMVRDYARRRADELKNADCEPAGER